jgi:hypothetical protein
VGAQEGAPLVVACGWRRDPPAAQDLADRARPDPVSEAVQLALDADNAPERKMLSSTFLALCGLLIFSFRESSSLFQQVRTVTYASATVA